MKILTKRIMRRVYSIWIMRKLKSPTTMKSAFLSVVLLKSFSVVSVSHVLANSPSILNPLASYQFFSNAFLLTDTFVRLLVISILAISLWLVQDFFKDSKISTLQY